MDYRLILSDQFQPTFTKATQLISTNFVSHKRPCEMIVIQNLPITSTAIWTENSDLKNGAAEETRWSSPINCLQQKHLKKRVNLA